GFVGLEKEMDCDAVRSSGYPGGFIFHFFGDDASARQLADPEEMVDSLMVGHPLDFFEVQRGDADVGDALGFHGLRGDCTGALRWCKGTCLSDRSDSETAL